MAGNQSVSNMTHPGPSTAVDAEAKRVVSALPSVHARGYARFSFVSRMRAVQARLLTSEAPRDDEVRSRRQAAKGTPLPFSRAVRCKRCKCYGLTRSSALRRSYLKR
jgi:hypothetical protein